MLLWVMLIAEAGKCGRGGALMISENKPYTAETLSLLLAMPKSVVEQGLELFVRLEMIEQVDVIRIRNWRKYQSEAKLEIRREKDRLRQQRYREKEPEVSQSLSRDVRPENRTEKNRVDKTTTEGVRLLLSQTPLSNISDQELGGLMQRHGPRRLRQAADVAAKTWRRDRGEIRNPGGYLNTLCETLVIPDWCVPPEERQKRARETRRRQEMQTAGLVVQQQMEELENKARDELWQSLSDTERDRFCTIARNECPVCTQPSEEVVQILAKIKAWEVRHYLAERSQLVGQKTLDLERQVIQIHLGQKLEIVCSSKESTLSTRSYTPTQVERIAHAQSEANSLATRLAYHAGLRVHELLTLRPAGVCLRSPPVVCGTILRPGGGSVHRCRQGWFGTRGGVVPRIGHGLGSQAVGGTPPGDRSGYALQSAL